MGATDQPFYNYFHIIRDCLICSSVYPANIVWIKPNSYSKFYFINNMLIFFLFILKMYVVGSTH